MRAPEPTITEGLIYVLVALLFLTFAANASKNPQRLGPAVYAEAR